MSQTQVVQTDSIEEEDPHNVSGKKQKSRRPASAQDPSDVRRFAQNPSNIVVLTQTLLLNNKD
jgi:hypothetical protein